VTDCDNSNFYNIVEMIVTVTANLTPPWRYGVRIALITVLLLLGSLGVFLINFSPPPGFWSQPEVLKRIIVYSFLPLYAGSLRAVLHALEQRKKWEFSGEALHIRSASGTDTVYPIALIKRIVYSKRKRHLTAEIVNPRRSHRIHSVAPDDATRFLEVFAASKFGEQ